MMSKSFCLSRSEPAKIFSRLLLTLLSAGILELSFPPGPFPGLVWLYLVPFQIALDSVGRKQGGIWGICFGVLCWLGSVWWVANGLRLWVTLPEAKAISFTGIYCLYAGIPYGVYGFIIGHFNALKTPLNPASKAALLTVLVLVFPNLFPGNPSHSLYTQPLMIQILDLGGVPLLFFVLNLSNLLTAECILKAFRKRNIAKPLGALCLLLAVVACYGWVRLDQLRAKIASASQSRSITIVSVQPDLPLGGMNVKTAAQKALGLSIDLIDKTPEAALVVWPELPVWFPWNEDNEHCRKIRDQARSLKIPFIICIGENNDGGKGYYNTALMVSGKKMENQAYQKQVLVPFGEYLPFERSLPFLRRFFPGTLRYIPGQADVLFDIAPGIRAVPSLCYEVVFPDHIRRFVKKGGNLILNMTDDKWFGKSPASAIHLSLGLFRAVEFRVPLVRVTNSGNGCFVRATGEIVPGSRTPDFQEAATAFSLAVPETYSFYLEWGDLFFYGLIVWLAVVPGLGRLKRFLIDPGRSRRPGRG